MDELALEQVVPRVPSVSLSSHLSTIAPYRPFTTVALMRKHSITPSAIKFGPSSLTCYLAAYGVRKLASFCPSILLEWLRKLRIIKCSTSHIGCLKMVDVSETTALTSLGSCVTLVEVQVTLQLPVSQSIRLAVEPLFWTRDHVLSLKSVYYRHSRLRSFSLTIVWISPLSDVLDLVKVKYTHPFTVSWLSIYL
jgi:hypothetical protein